jgi:hypothetical protein
VSFSKDPDAKLDYTVDWTKWLNGDTISKSEWIVPDGLNDEDDSNTSTTATIWLSGGTTGHEYTVTNRITTAGSRVNDRSFKILAIEE